MDNKAPGRHLTRWLLIGMGTLLVLTLLVVHLVPAPKLMIATDTTVITSPLNADGTPDYIAYLDALQSEGITADNNAAPLLVRALGNLAIDVTYPSYAEPLCARLGLTLEEVGRGPHINSQVWQALIDAGEMPADFAQESEWDTREGVTGMSIHDITEVMRTRISVRRQLSAWLEEIEPALELVRQASLKNRLYSPAVILHNDSYYIPLQEYEITKALETRACLHIVNGDTQRAWHDALTLYRLAGLFGKVPAHWRQDEGIWISKTATGLAIFLAEHGQLPPQKLRSFLLQMRQIPEIAINEQALDKDARFNCLGELIEIAQADGELPPTLESQYWAKSLFSGKDLSFALFPWDVNEALRHLNKLWDQRVASMRLADYPSRHAALVSLEEELEKEVYSAIDRHYFYQVTLWAMGALTHAERGRYVGAAHLFFEDEGLWQQYDFHITEAAALRRQIGRAHV